MSIDRITYLQKYLHNPSNDAAGYGVRVLEADVAQGETYWRIIGVHHLEPEENWGRHLVYIDVIDETGGPIQIPCAWADWTWEGRDEAVPTLPIALDGPEFEPAGQLPLADPSQPVSVWLKGLYADADDTSDRVENLHTGHPDELTSDGQLGNGIGHHSFYVVFQRTRKGEDSTSGADQEETILSFDAPTPEAEAEPSPHRRHKIGLDANRPIIIDHGPRLGAPADTVANPEMIAATGAAWVRINFVLGPWLGPNDQTRFQGLTWAETYEAIVDSFLDRGLNVYGLIGHESVRQSPDFFMDAPNDMPGNEISRARDWIAEYARSFREIVERFYPKVKVFESFNEPDNWHNGHQAWIHPHWFAHMLHEIHDQVRAGLGLSDVSLVSGPLQGLSINRNEAPTNYLRQTYQYGQERLHWGQDGRPYPFDGVGYHLYIHEGYKPDWPAQERAVRETYRHYVDGMRRVIRAHEGATSPKQLYISEIGWPSNRDTAEEKEFQARNLSLALELMLDDPAVALGIWFCTEDFAPGSKFYGLYQMGRVTPEGRKQAFVAFQTICDHLNRTVLEPEPEVEGDFSNQTLITAFYRVASQLGLDGWALMVRADVDPNALVRDRQALYTGPSIDDLNLSDEERRLLKEALADLTRVIEEAEAFDIAFSGPTDEAEPRFLRLRPELAELPLPPPTNLHISPEATQTSEDRRTRQIWNRYGLLLLRLADIFKFKPGVGVAVLAIESGGRGFAGDGRMIIRFENHIFNKYWGVHQPAQFNQHFRFDPDRRWQKHQWRPSTTGDWREFHGKQSGEWDVFEFARLLDSRAAMLSISMGLPQIMGFNHKVLGYDSVATMFESFSLSERDQLLGFFDFVCGPLADRRRLFALQEGDFETFAIHYNGAGQAVRYAALLQSALESFERLSPM